MNKGCLYIISGPIGNLSDVTLRALEVLKQVDVILSEDTRNTSILLDKYGISGKSQVSYRDQNHDKIYSYIKDSIENGVVFGLITDSGTPLISDPGYKLVSQLRDLGLDVFSVPGPSSVLAALSISGLPTDKFTFLGFAPKKNGELAKTLNMYSKTDSTLVIFESPFRIRKLIQSAQQLLGDRKSCLVKDITKKFECIYYGKLSQIYQSLPEKPKGEYILLISKEGM